jgi:hypothetical protein
MTKFDLTTGEDLDAIDCLFNEVEDLVETWSAERRCAFADRLERLALDLQSQTPRDWTDELIREVVERLRQWQGNPDRLFKETREVLDAWQEEYNCAPPKA